MAAYPRLAPPGDPPSLPTLLFCFLPSTRSYLTGLFCTYLFNFDTPWSPLFTRHCLGFFVFISPRRAPGNPSLGPHFTERQLRDSVTYPGPQPHSLVGAEPDADCASCRSSLRAGVSVYLGYCSALPYPPEVVGAIWRGLNKHLPSDRHGKSRGRCYYSPIQMGRPRQSRLSPGAVGLGFEYRAEYRYRALHPPPHPQGRGELAWCCAVSFRDLGCGLVPKQGDKQTWFE